MTKWEEKAWQHFEKLKNILPQLLPHWWKKDFKFMSIDLLKSILTQKISSLRYQVKMKKTRTLTIYTFMGYDTWWQVHSRN
jgi:hypothetical protein